MTGYARHQLMIRPTQEAPVPTLYVAATPIGNLSDASPRLLQTLQNVSLIAAEDTRVTVNLLRHFGIEKPLTSLHRYNEKAEAEHIVARMLDEGIDVALVTDAGTPAISDPGFLLVALAHQNDLRVVAIAGPSAVAAALSLSGFDASEFGFYGFLPRGKKDRAAKMRSLTAGPKVAVFYESPHRVIEWFETAAEVFPECVACVCREMTKLHEQTIRGTTVETLAALRANPMAEKGEHCIVLNLHDYHSPVQETVVSTEARLLELLIEDHPMRDALDLLHKSGVRKNDAKRAAIRVRQWLTKVHAFEKESPSNEQQEKSGD